MEACGIEAGMVMTGKILVCIGVLFNVSAI